MADGYRDVEVRDMASSWKSGLAFCAIIHRFRPDLIDYESLDKENVFENNNLAFEVAERELSIPAFLEAEDMVAIRVPDKLSVVTYVSQYYNYFHNKPQLGGPGVNKFVSQGNKKKDATPDKQSLTPTNKNVESVQNKGKQESIGDKCSLCHDKVFLLERHLENNRLYHRSCFRKSDQSPTSKVFKRQPPGSSPLDSGGTSKIRKVEELAQPSSGDKGSTPDFWQRRAQAKSKDSPAVNELTGDKNKGTTKVDSDRTSVSVPSWSKRQDIKQDSEKNKTSNGVKGAMFNKPDSHQTNGVTNTGNLVNRFKELDERNKQQIGAASSNNGKEASSLLMNKNAPFGSPVPKPRQTKFEKMEVDLTDPHPKPVPRALNKPVSPQPSPRKTDQKADSPKVKTKTKISRPKTPPLSTSKANFSITLSSTGHPETSTISPASPPPLPPSSPPRLTISDPPKIDTVTAPKKTEFKTNISTNKSESPVSSPRSKLKHDVKVSDTSNIKDTTSHSQPQRGSGFNVGLSPMDTSEGFTTGQAVVHDPKYEQKAVLVVPNRQNNEKKNRVVFGGLLKSLADVRTKHDKEIKPTDVSEAKSDKRFSKNILAKDEEKSKGMDKKDIKIDISMGNDKKELKFDLSKEKNKPDKKMDFLKDSDKKDTKFKVPPRPKSSFVSQSTSLFSDDVPSKQSQIKSNITTKTTTTTTVTTVDKGKVKKTEKVETVTNTVEDSNIPELKKNLQKNKFVNPRPKSADLLSDRTSDKTDWQIEAENRKKARKDGYIDPEKTKVHVDSNVDKTIETPQNRNSSALISVLRPLSLPTEEKKEDKPGPKKVIRLSENFVFGDNDLGSTPKKPPRLDVSVEGDSGHKNPRPPSRPPPPSTSPSAALSGNTKQHLSAYQIQHQLQLIDEKLTRLELKGRELEVQIRSAEESTEDESAEDELMISWFQLVNEKNELVRMECDYIYVSRQQELEDKQQEIENKLRKLVLKPESMKTEADLKNEEDLMMKKVDIVNQRNNIVESIDEDRLRYLEEDKDIEYMLRIKAFKQGAPKLKKKDVKIGFLKEKHKSGGMKKDKKKDKK